METSPYAIWIKIAAVLLILGGVSVGSWHLAVKSTNADWINKQNELVAKQNAQVKILNATINGLEESARLAQQKRTQDYLQGITDGRKQTEDTIAQLRASNSGLWLQVHESNDRSSRAEDAAIQSKRDAAKAAQLTTETSEALIRITADGDEAIKQLGLCQAEYKGLWDYTDRVVKEYNKYRFGK